jgi:hypothetical protein
LHWPLQFLPVSFSLSVSLPLFPPLFFILLFRSTARTTVTYCEKSSDDDNEDFIRRHRRRKEIESDIYDDASDYEAEENLSKSKNDSNDDDDDDDDSNDDSIDICSDEEGDSSLINMSELQKDLARRRIRGKESKVRVPTVEGGRKIQKKITDENPLNLVRSVPVGKSNHETFYDFFKRCFLKYKEIHGNVLVPRSLSIPWSESWPEEMWGVKLGSTVRDIRNNKRYSIHRDELIAIGFDYSKQEKGHGWNTVKIALETYKKLHGNLSIKGYYVVPSESTDWPDVLWGLKLGTILVHIRYDGYYTDHRQELIEMGVDYTIKGRKS